MFCAPDRGKINPLLTNGFSHHYQLGESTLILGVCRVIFIFFISFFNEISLCKQNSPIWDAAFCGVTSRAILFANVPQKGHQANMSLFDYDCTSYCHSTMSLFNKYKNGIQLCQTVVPIHSFNHPFLGISIVRGRNQITKS